MESTFLKKIHKYLAKCKNSHNQIPSTLVAQSEVILNKIEDLFPQARMNKGKNVWIVKPAGLSRGRGIACYNNLAEIVEHIRIRDVDWVIQKYIENPLIILNRKVSPSLFLLKFKV